MVSSASPLDLEVRNTTQKRNVSELEVGIKTRDKGYYYIVQFGKLKSGIKENEKQLVQKEITTAAKSASVDNQTLADV